MSDHLSRQYPRFAIEAAVQLHGPDTVATGRTDNVSRGGLCAVVDRPLAAGSQVQVNLSLVFDEETFSEPLSLPARVVWCTAMGDEHQLGTSFLGLNSEQQSYLEMFLRYLEEGLAARDAGAAADPDDDDPDDDPDDPFAS
jgi:hypothetical protein